MKINGFRFFEGRNVHCHRAAAEVDIDLGSLTNVLTSDIDGFNQRLLTVMPGLKDHYCGAGKPGGFVERLYEGTLLGHVVEHVALELQSLVGIDVIYGKTRRLYGDGIYRVVFECPDPEVAAGTAQSAVRIVELIRDGHEAEVASQIWKIRALASESLLGPSTMGIISAAKARDIPMIRLSRGSLVQLGYGKYQKRIMGSMAQSTSSIAVDIACDKTLTKKFLSEFGIPVPAGSEARDLDEALKIAAEIGYPVVIKPHDGNQGKGVLLNLRNKEEVAVGFNIASVFSKRVIVEKYVVGRHYRLLVVGDRVRAVAEKVPAHVIGDGIHNVAQLIDLANEDPRRGDGHEKPLTMISVDQVVALCLARQGLNIKSVPAPGKVVYLRDSANLSTGGVSIDVTDEADPGNLDLAVHAVKAVGLDIAGVDVVTEDISLPLWQTGGAVIEVNASPGLRMHLYPWKGKAREVGSDIVDFIFPKGSISRIPVVAVTGTNGKTTVTRMIAEILTDHSLKVGMATSDGIYIAGRLIAKGDCTGPRSAMAVLMSSDVEAAVLETARGGIIRGGLGFDWCDVGVVTNISEDHLGQDGINTISEMANVKSLVIEAVAPQGKAVLNADDPVVLSMASKVRRKTVLFSKMRNSISIRKHLLAGNGEAVYLDHGVICVSDGQRETKVVSVKSIPAVFGGKAWINVENALAAVAAAIAMGIPVETIRKSLKSFQASPEQNPGRLNLLEVSGVKILVDYGHNAEAVKSVIDVARSLCPGARMVGVIASPGDRRDDLIINLGRVAGRGFARLYIKEDEDLRGRKPGEVARLLELGAKEGGLKQSQISFILKEEEAVLEALNSCTARDLVVVFYEKFDRVMNVIREWSRISSQPLSVNQKAMAEAGL